MRKLIWILILLPISKSFSQISINAGTGFLKGFSTDTKPFFGFSGGFELPKSNDVTFYGRVGYYFAQREPGLYPIYVTANDPNTTSPYNLQVNYETKTNYTTLEGGTRYYLGNDYDNGFSLYGGGNFMLYFNSVSRDYEDRDITGTYEWQNKYQLSPNEPTKGKIVSLAFGLQGGLKYTLPATGTFYFDLGGFYTIFGQPSSNNIPTDFYSPIFFTFNLGFRKDLY
jgi:hypothetical protein